MAIALVNFCPNQSYIISASTTTANQLIAQPSIPGGQPYTDLYVYNAAAAVAYIGWGTASNTAATNANIAVAPGNTVILNMGSGYNYVAALLASSTGNVYISVGNGN